METKTVHAHSRETGLYLGPVTLDESDRSPLEPDVWHIPGNCVEDEPPAIPAGHVAVRVGDAWQLIEVMPAPQIVAEVAPQQVAQPAAPTRDELVQRHLDAVARSFGYDSIMSAISYAEEPAVAKFQAEGRALRAWRSLAWAAAHELPEDTAAEALAGMLPEFKMPEAKEAATPARAKRQKG